MVDAFPFGENVYHLLYCSYHTILCPSFVMGCYLTKRVFFSTTQNGDLLVCADLLNVFADDDIAELFVQFDGAADAVGLLPARLQSPHAAGLHPSLRPSPYGCPQ